MGTKFNVPQGLDNTYFQENNYIIKFYDEVKDWLANMVVFNLLRTINIDIDIHQNSDDK